MNTRKNSQILYHKALENMPGGVNSPVRAFNAVGGEPLFIEKAMGSKLYDVDGNEYIDYVSAFGPMILGHAHSRVTERIKDVVEKGTCYGCNTELELQLASMIKEAFPSIDLIRMVNSGTEATMSAIRLSRAVTLRDKIIKFDGCYHGHSDGLLIKAGSGGVTFNIPDSAGITKNQIGDTLTLPFNDEGKLSETFERHGKEIASVILEPIPGNMGVIEPRSDFLKEVRRLTEEHGSLLILDEVITGFRLCYGGAQRLYNIIPDLTCLGKIIGGGLPIGAYGGKREIMERVSPLSDVYQAGTLSGNSLAMAAGIETLKILSEDSTLYCKLDGKAKKICKGIREKAIRNRMELSFPRVGSMFTIFFTQVKPYDYESAKRSDTERYKKFFNAMLDEGIYFPPSQFEASFISSAHSDEDIEETLLKIDKFLSNFDINFNGEDGRVPQV